MLILLEIKLYFVGFNLCNRREKYLRVAFAVTRSEANRYLYGISFLTPPVLSPHSAQILRALRVHWKAHALRGC